MSSPPVRALVDHEVDRPQLQAPRGVQASGTNSPSSCFDPGPRGGGGLGEEERLPNDAMRPPGRRESRTRRGRPARARPRRRGWPDPIPNSAKARHRPKYCGASPRGGRTPRSRRRVRPHRGRAALGGPEGPFRVSRGPRGPLSFYAGLYISTAAALIFLASFLHCTHPSLDTP